VTEGERVEIVRTLLEMFRRRENDTPFAFGDKIVDVRSAIVG
jgi:hypothetical protein